MITRTIVKTLIFDENDNLLLLRRSKDDEHRPGELDLPGGGVDEGEDITAAAVREITEEAGVTLQPSQLKLVYSYSSTGYNTSEKQDTNLVRLFFVTHLTARPSIKLSSEHSEYMWLSPAECDTRIDYHRYRELFEYLKTNDILTDPFAAR
jgi:8-oxo-dGTP pyrophosphatase MutT (NUDIX family)